MRRLCASAKSLTMQDLAHESLLSLQDLQDLQVLQDQ